MRFGKWLVLVMYLLVLTKFILFKQYPSLNLWQVTDKSQLALRWESANLIPFQSIRLFLAPSNLTPSIRLQNLAGNVLLFVPLGLLLPFWFHRCRRFFSVTGAAAGLSLFYEVVQLLFGFGSFDVDDLLLNTIGGMIGYGLFFLFKKRRRDQT
ncbi:VanZ family protein [Domibacillus sp. A3M-37]|uniref:VanZ family protein n=1 Tax=Domibacillus sp. A3M-37 TaxID=2962037 RepID=UPI0020B6DCAA|nr:VanZ family protein [Domibacillus sp. A3M-37]MCP3760954.1 VanZ family protein [Domibacillus sp. A3M-37]